MCEVKKRHWKETWIGSTRRGTIVHYNSISNIEGGKLVYHRSLIDGKEVIFPIDGKILKTSDNRYLVIPDPESGKRIHLIYVGKEGNVISEVDLSLQIEYDYIVIQVDRSKPVIFEEDGKLYVKSCTGEVLPLVDLSEEEEKLIST